MTSCLTFAEFKRVPCSDRINKAKTWWLFEGGLGNFPTSHMATEVFIIFDTLTVSKKQISVTCHVDLF